VMSSTCRYRSTTFPSIVPRPGWIWTGLLYDDVGTDLVEYYPSIGRGIGSARMYLDKVALAQIRK
jgi:hypothetical protein